MWNVTRISYGESWKARMQGGSVEEGLCGDFVAMAYFRQQRGDVAHLVSKDSKEVLVSSLEPTSVPVIWLPFANRNSDEVQTSEHS
ncbi:hypothetical protein Tco_0723460 [Tanacetum coccineum]